MMDGGISPKSAQTEGAAAGKGRLTIVGSGIKAVAHFTQETVAHIRDADVVFYKVIDGASAAFIRDLNPNAIDLSQYYGDDKRRRITYIQMAEVMLREVRAGRTVVGVFYGHPGFFVDPARRALAVAAKEGYPTEMLAGVSSTDTLFADLRIDPAQSGLQMLEATDLLLRNRPLVTSGHVVILQVGSVGDAAYNFAHGFRNNKRAILFERLIETYGPDHVTVLYLAASLPGVAPQLIRRRLSAYRDPAVLASVHPASTLYIPPGTVLDTDPTMAEKLGAQWVLNPAAARRAPISEYGPLEAEAVQALAQHARSPHYKAHLASPALLNVIMKLALDPAASRAFEDAPEQFLENFPYLTDAERKALLSRNVSRLVSAMVVPNRGAASPGNPPPSDSDVSMTEEDAPEGMPPSDTDLNVTENVPPSNTDLHITENVPSSDTDLNVTENVPPSDTDLSVTEDAPSSDTDLSVTEDIPMSNTDLHITENVPPSDSDVSVADEDQR